MSSNEALIQYWYARLPRSLAPLVPRIAAAVSDGAWAAVWVRAAAWAPPVVFGIGLLVPRTWPGTQVVYTESPLFLAVAPALSILSGTAGVALLLANGLREVLSHDMASSLNAAAHVGAGQLIVWLLLAVLVVILPQLAHLLAEAVVVRIRLLRYRDARAICRSLLLATIFPGLVLLWCQAATVLVLPVFTRTGNTPSAAAISTVGAWWTWMAAATAAAALARGLLEGIVAPRMRRASTAAALTQARLASAPAAGSAWHDVPEAVRVSLAAAGMTLLMAGMFEGPADALIAGLFIGGLAMLARGLGGWLTGFWGLHMRQTSSLLRVVAALGGATLVAGGILALDWNGTALRAMLVASLATLTLLVVLFPARIVRPRRPQTRRISS